MLFVRSLAKRLEGSGVVVNAVHPGVIASALDDALDERLWAESERLIAAARA